jgi:hypothetical protein
MVNYNRENKKEYYDNNKEHILELRKRHYEKNKDDLIVKFKNRREDLKQHAIQSISSGEIINLKKWNTWCDDIKRKAKKNPYSNDFTNDVIFKMLSKGCFYCGDLAIGIDRVDSKLNHMLGNCVASCWGCNASKGAADSATFIRKAYFRVTGRYLDDDTQIWAQHNTKPRWDAYKRRAEKKGVLFELTKRDFEILIKGECAYCKRTPTTWFGIDRIKPDNGYVLENAVPCCLDCNTDKFEDDINMMKMRNERIATRVTNHELVIEECEKVIIHKGTNKTSAKVCVYGKVYASKSSASRSLGKCDRFVFECIRYGRYSEDIFEISDDFFTEYKDRTDITLEMFKNIEKRNSM